METSSVLFRWIYWGLWISFWMPTIIQSLSSATTNLEIGWLAMIPSLIGIPAILFVGGTQIGQVGTNFI